VLRVTTESTAALTLRPKRYERARALAEAVPTLTLLEAVLSCRPRKSCVKAGPVTAVITPKRPLLAIRLAGWLRDTTANCPASPSHHCDCCPLERTSAVAERSEGKAAKLLYGCFETVKRRNCCCGRIAIRAVLRLYGRRSKR
jgi:hypothetical protein